MLSRFFSRRPAPAPPVPPALISVLTKDERDLRDGHYYILTATIKKTAAAAPPAATAADPAAAPRDS